MKPGHALGNWYEHRETREVYIMARGGKMGYVGLVNLIYGGYMRMLYVNDMQNICQTEFNKMTHFRANDFVQIENPLRKNIQEPTAIIPPGGAGF